MSESKFNLGQVVATPNAIDTLNRCGVQASTLLARHHVGDWGDTCVEDAGHNDAALIEGERLFSVYKLTEADTIWVITESDRSSTCVLLPEDY